MPDDEDVTRTGPPFELSSLPHDPDLGPEAEGPSGPIEPRGLHELTLLVAVLVGGFLGTLGRYEVDLAWPTPAGQFPSSTFVINTSGALVLGALLTVLLGAQPLGHRQWRAFLGTGVLGGWTTYSTLAVAGTTLVKTGHGATAAGYLAASLGAGLVAVGLGMALGRLVVARRSGAGGRNPTALPHRPLDPDQEPA
jgi:CrcB protein